jgi:hypothetical protein
MFSISFITSCFAITGDVTGDNKVDVADLIIFADQWLTAGTSCDFDSSGKVDFKDFGLLAQNWYGELITMPDKASNPSPSNNTTGISLDTSLSWSGNGSTYNVYFGTANPPPFLAAVVTKTAEISTLNYGTVYYWRVDSINRVAVTEGDVWSFNSLGNQAPSANDISVSTYTFIPTEIILQSTDDGLPSIPGKLKCYITDLPGESGYYVQDPTSGGQSRIRESDLPYRLSTWGKQIIFATSNAGSDLIKYKTFDGLLYSAEKTITVNIAANPQDCLSFDGSGFVTISDSDYFDIADGRVVGICFATRQSNCTIASKYEIGQPGYEMKLVNGKLVVNFYNTSGLAASESSQFNYNTGSWVNAAFGYNHATGKLELYIGFGQVAGVGWFSDFETHTDEEASDIPLDNYANGCDFIIGQNFKGEIDAPRAYTVNMADDPFRTLCVVQSRQTAGNTESWVPAPVVRFTCNLGGNNTATQIYDDISAAHLIGTFNSSDHVKYIPFQWHWYDSAFFHQVTK